MDAKYENWISRWQAALNACKRKGGETRELVIMPPATEAAVVEVEAEVEMALPTSFRKVLTEFSSHVGSRWLLPDEFSADNTALPKELHGIFGGGAFWDLTLVTRYEKRRVNWVETNFSDPDDPYDCVWHNKLAFDKVANGDLLAFDLSILPDSPVVYLSHDDGEGHGYRLGDNFIDFMERWSLLGCPGNEDWQMMPFLPDATSGLDAYGENAQKWREWFGLGFGVNKP